MWRLLLALLLIASPAYAQRQATAYDALKVVGTQFHRAALSRVISVSGVDGDPQPTTWTVVISDRNAPGGMRELQVSGGRIVSDQTPSHSAGTPINTARLNLDSNGAFTVASHTADQAHTNFDRVAYTLRNNDRGYPVWIVTIQDLSGRPLGTIHISANGGNVTRVEGMYHGANMASVAQDAVDRGGSRAVQNRSRKADDYVGADVDVTTGDEPGDPGDDDGDVNVVKAEIKKMFRRTKRDAERMFQRVRRPFEEFIMR